MRKNTLVIFLLLLSFSSFGKEYSLEMTRRFSLQAGFDSAMDISITPIAAQSQSYIAGMPFSIEDGQVQYQNTSQGREIARWNVLSNTDFNIKISGTKLFPVDETGQMMTTKKGLDYYLVFDYRLGYVTASGQYEATGTEEYYSANGTEYFTDLTEGYTGDVNAFIGGVDGSIFFRFDEASSVRIASDSSNDSSSEDYLPPGDYHAEVTITLEGKI